MQLLKDKSVLQNFKDANEYEWLETNGLGGWSSSSIIGANTRRYHGLFVAAIVPPTERMVLLSKLDETIVLNNKRMELGCNLFKNDVIHPTGNDYIKSFNKELFPEWIYEVEGIRIKKKIGMVHNENTVVILYDVLKAPGAFTLELLPLIAARGSHSLQHAGPQMRWDATFNDGVFHNQPDGTVDLYISIPGSSYQHKPGWFTDFKYSVEEYRGLDFMEDLFNHGLFSIHVQKGDSIGIIISTENPAGRDANKLLASEEKRKRKLLKDQPEDLTIQQLVLAADQFIVKRGENLKTIIAGYHWFTDWGRDTMIALPGLCLSTGRFEDARKIIAAFAKSVSMGMLPNRFQDNNELPEYNNVDGTLWYFIAIQKYFEASGDSDFILKEILPVLKDIIDWHFRGTRYNIHVDTDGLLFAGEKGQQLTWMDARIGDWVVTPRMGKPVEVQALWYNALKVFAQLLQLNNQPHDAELVELSAAKTKESFDRLFWYTEGNYLFDVIDENGNGDASIRPNQLFAISLPFSLLDDEKSRLVVNLVTAKLYTPVGLRSLPTDDDRYVHQYGGDSWHRDGSYHQGTVWSWLLGAYVDALMKLKGKNYKTQVKSIIKDFVYHLNEGGIGTVSEIFDADAPHHPRGCIAQAWSVAELLRVIKAYKINLPGTKNEPVIETGNIG